MFDLDVAFDGGTTRVTIRSDALDQTGAYLAEVTASEPPSGILVLTDERVGEYYAASVLKSLTSAGFHACEHRIPHGETSKSLSILGEVYAALVRCRLGRDGVILALGGGVVSDLAGLAAATWMRGVRFVVCPTTLEADIDAAIGGKTAINVPGGKNLVGAFHQPMLVVVDPACLETLDPRDVRAGMAESIKHALISSEAFLQWHETNADAILTLDRAAVRELIVRNLRVKANIVSRDAQERAGRRILLNFGHTIGHAIEAGCGFTLRHGECVALGMLAAQRLSNSLGILDAAVVERTERLLDRFDLPTALVELIDAETILSTMHYDKKVRGGTGRFVLLEAVGKPIVRADVPDDEVRKAYESLL